MALSLALGGWVVAASGAVLALVLSRLLAARMEAVARACHELRGPLTAARLGLQLAIRGGELPPARMRAIDLELSRAALALEDLAAARAGRPTRRAGEQVDVRQLLADSVESWRVRAAARGIDLRLTPSGAPARIWGDRLRLAQATGNLIANAVEHGGGPIEVRCRLEDGRVRIEVIDGGMGLPAPVAHLARQPRGGVGARGRGLAIATKIAEEHGGRLAAAPSKRGARLVLELPPADAPLRTPAAG
jgi:signal transduction histidine kinase